MKNQEIAAILEGTARLLELQQAKRTAASITGRRPSWLRIDPPPSHTSGAGHRIANILCHSRRSVWRAFRQSGLSTNT
jgi:hypothetical protein